jgi:hypothetical protein
VATVTKKKASKKKRRVSRKTAPIWGALALRVILSDAQAADEGLWLVLEVSADQMGVEVARGNQAEVAEWVMSAPPGRHYLLVRAAEVKAVSK